MWELNRISVPLCGEFEEPAFPVSHFRFGILRALCVELCVDRLAAFQPGKSFDGLLYFCLTTDFDISKAISVVPVKVLPTPEEQKITAVIRPSRAGEPRLVEIACL